MNTSIRQAICVCGIAIFIIGASTLAIGVQFVVSANSSSKPSTQEQIDMIVFVSPQYADDKEISDAITSYVAAVKDDLGWSIKVIGLTPETNDYLTIDQIIEQYWSLYAIRACLMVGEDIDTALAGDHNYMEKPSTVPWFTTGGTKAYAISEQGIICQSYTMDICISLLYPTSSLGYSVKKSQIIAVFHKFSNQRYNNYFRDILVFESSDINTNSKELYQNIRNSNNLYYCEDPTNFEIDNSLSDSYSMFFVHGHSNPSGTDINANKEGWFSADYIDELDTPLFGADGCYVGGWWSDQLDNNILDRSIDHTWYGSKFFTSRYIQVMVLGMLSQNGYSSSVSFIENVIPELFEGKTLAESMIGEFTCGDTIIIGDPTFHFTT